MTAEGVSALIHVRLSKPPFVEELAKLVLEKSALSTESLQSSSYARLELVKALAATTLQELDDSIREILAAEVREITKYMPAKYTPVVESLTLFLDFESIAAEPSKYLSSKVCDGGGLDCLLRGYVQRVKDSMASTGEEIDRPLSILALALYGVFLRHSMASKRLGVKTVDDPERAFNEVIGLLGGTGSVYYSGTLGRMTTLAPLWEKDPFQYIAEEAKLVVTTSKTALYFSGRLLDLLTHFFVTRYYETRLLRILVSRRILSVG
ncbi:MAG: hypothetical protein ACP5HP_05390 [Thermogladius sp.]